MKKILALLALLLSMQVFAGTMEYNVQKEEPVDVELDKRNPNKNDTHPRTLIPITCVYVDGEVHLSLLGEVGNLTLTVTNQTTSECWSAVNALTLQTSTAAGIYWVQIETEDGTVYYGTYTLQ